jgi:Fe-S oxidoreductase
VLVIGDPVAGRGPAPHGERRRPGEGGDLAEALRRAVGGEVRFDPYSRHLFSRDASMYAIEPIGVVLDLSRHMHRIIEVDAERRVARVQPGVVQEQLNLAAATHGLVFGPDTSTSNRATLGGMIGNNSAGSQSVRYGMTIDHVLALDVVLADASQAAFGPLTDGELRGRAAAPTLAGTICRELPGLVERHREAIATGFPRFWRQSGGYRLDRLGRVPAHPPVPGPQRARPAGADARGRRGGARAIPGVRRGQFERARRRARPERVQPPGVRRRALRGHAGDEAALRPREPDEPGKIVNAPAMTDHLRDVAQPAAPPLATRLRFDTPGGMRGAADRCMNIGLCRKTSAGVMCPSYMATRDEEHSTRGRANALLHALSMPDPRAALGDDRLHAILDLCLECKACLSECPLGVDMAALKTEALAAYQDRHGVPLRSRMFGSIRTLNRLGSATFPLSNLASGWRPARLAAQRWLGVSAARPLPRFQRHDLRSWFRRRPDPAVPAAQGELIFLADSFTTFTEPSAGRAAIELLELAGWRVRFEDGGCCGRASLSKGLVEAARRMAAGMAGRLGEAAARGVPIVGVEPSCLLTLRGEYAALLSGHPGVSAVAAATRLPEELLLEAVAEGRLVLPRASALSGRRVLFHGHCHQKALAGTAATTALLRSIPGADVVEVDAGCCGMAGSFGFEAEHYALSMGIGQLRLFPAVGAEPEGTIIAATGVSCRQQIAHGTGGAARHPLEIIRQALLDT